MTQPMQHAWLCELTPMTWVSAVCAASLGRTPARIRRTSASRRSRRRRSRSKGSMLARVRDTHDNGALSLCSFHGKDPSKNKKDKRFRKVQEEQERKRRTMSAIGEDHALSRLAAVQEQSATPYLVRPPVGAAQSGLCGGCLNAVDICRRCPAWRHA